MRMSVYLHRYVVDTLKCIDKDLSKAINRVLNYCDTHNGLTDYPKCSDRRGAGRYEVEIECDNYIIEYVSIGSSSPRVSLRRILYWFVDNEVYGEADFGEVSEVKTETKDVYLLRKCVDIIEILNKMKSKCDSKKLTILYKINDNIKELEGIINEGEQVR